MRLEATFIKDLFLLHKPIRRDERGRFCRLYGVDEIAEAGRSTDAVHVNSSTSAKAGTLRGIHYQYPPYAEEKVVSCVSGAIWDLAVDLRPESQTRFKWFGAKLTPDNGLSLIVPKGFGHAFITLEDNSTVIYVVSAIYSFEHEGGARYNDPLLKIDWPIKPEVISEKDQSWGLIEDRLEEIESNFLSLK